MSFKYKQAILGGTFDKLHVGHQRLIDETFKQSTKVTIGITTAKFIKDKFLSETIENYTLREKSLKEYLKKKEFLKRVSFIPLDNIFGNSLKEKDIDAIFVTKLTFKNANLINIKRKEKGLNLLKIITVPLKKGDDCKIITSERIRYGEIDRDGFPYSKIFKNKQRFLLPEDLRKELRKPTGIVIKEEKEVKNLRAPFFIAVGDIVSIFLLRAGRKANISIIDLRTQRKKIDKKEIAEFLKRSNAFYVNQPGTINVTAVNGLIRSKEKYFKTKEKQVITIDGEEDLLALPAILFAPLQSLVLYGLFEVGAIAVRVTEKKKSEITKILKKFSYE